MEGAVTYDPETYQHLANCMAQDIEALVTKIHATVARQFGDGTESLGDAAPLVQGALGGVVLFMLRGEASDAKIQEIFAQVLDMLPQFRMEIAAAGMPEGNA